MSLRTKNSGKQAFTLVEVILAIAVIGILAAILIPKASRTREAAKNAVIHAFLHDCRTIQTQLKFGKAPDYQTQLNRPTRYSDLLQAAPFGNITFTLTDENTLKVQNIPPGTFKNGVTAVTITYQGSPVYDGLTESEFLQHVLW